MTLTRSFIRGAAMTPLDARLFNMAELVCNADGTPRAGVLGQANPSIVSATATMNVAIAAAEFATSKGKADGVAVFTNDGTVNVLIGAAPASNSRIDVIWVKHNDTETGDANSLPTFGVTAGAAAASPTKPAIPTGALELATLLIYSGTTATNGGANTLTNTYAMTAQRGGVVPFRTKTDLDAWTTAIVGQEAVTLDTGEKWIRSGGSWLLTFRPLLPWSPAITGLTVGNGQLRALYSKRDKVVEFFIELESGSTTAATGQLGFSAPEPPADIALVRHVGEGFFNYTGATSGAWPIQPRIAGGSTINATILDASGGTVVPASNISNIFPTSGAWSGSNLRPSLYLHGTYRTAA